METCEVCGYEVDDYGCLGVWTGWHQHEEKKKLFQEMQTHLTIEEVLLYQIRVLQSEVDRLKRGDFTEEEFQNLCHNLSEADEERFVKGCEEYQRKLFGDNNETRS